MVENQNIEFKEIWKDEYLKWICGMANAKGGTIYIGKNDEGKTVGISNAIKLVKEIPNKIRDTMGILPEVKIEKDGALSYISIKVESYPTPISYHGKLYLRSGSNNHEVTSNELSKFLLDKVGKHWDELPVKEATFADLSEEAIKTFKEKAVKNNRLRQEDVDIDDEFLLKNLGLYNGQYLNEAAILLFGKEPEKWVVGSYIKLGFFENNDADLRYQDEITGPLILQVDKALELIYLKYMKALIHYEGIQRVEEFMFPHDALREILLNSVIHKCYEGNIPIQVSIYDDKIYIWNQAKFPFDLIDKNLYEKHQSVPYNPLIAQTFFKAGFIESWGRGYEQIRKVCLDYNYTPNPKIEIGRDGIMIQCTPSKIYLKLLKELNNNPITNREKNNDREIDREIDRENFSKNERKILDEIEKNPYITQKELVDKIKISDKTIRRNITLLKEKNIIIRIGSDRKGYWKINSI